MNTQYHINLNNEYEYKYLCVQKSAEAFESTLAKRNFPSRLILVDRLIKEIAYSPFYLASKMGEMGINLLRMCSQLTKKPFYFADLANITELVILQTLTPIICLVMRVSASVLGFIYFPWAIKGWKLAESGESLSYLLWSDFFTQFNCQHSNKKVYGEITPSNAIFYLGERRVSPSLGKDAEDQLQLKISNEFSSLLQALILNDPDIFHKLYDHDLAIDPANELSEQISYPITSELKKILLCLKKHLAEEGLGAKEMCDRFWKDLSPKEMHVLFNYTYFHLRGLLLEGKLNTNTTKIETHLTQLKDLWSQRFFFGRAYFPSSLWDFQSYASD